jgi:hypothetical protein
MKYVPSPTGDRFLADRSFSKLICGPIGSGKSTVALMDLFLRALGQAPHKDVRRTKFIILRNTLQQLQATVKPLLDTWFVTLTGGTFGQWRLTDKTFELHLNLPDGTHVFSEFCLMAADTPDDVRRLLSLEASAAWVEEAREVDEEVFSGLAGRVARFPNRAAGGVTYPGLICSTNPPPMGTFWQSYITNPPDNAAVFMQPPALLEDGSINPEAENLENLDPEYYDNILSGKSDGWVGVYLRNEFGPGEYGSPIFKASFKRSWHVSEHPLQAIPSVASPLVVGMDNGLQAAATVMQQDARARVNVLSICYVPFDQTMGVEAFLDRLLIPHLTSTYTVRRENFLFVLDPACFHRSQVNEATIAQAVQARGFRAQRASTNDPDKRKGAVEGLLTRAIDGGPGLLIDPRCTHLIDGLDWGYRYKKNAAGQGTLTIEKNHHSHQCESFEYSALHFNAMYSQTFTAFQTKAREVKRRAYAYV